MACSGKALSQSHPTATMTYALSVAATEGYPYSSPYRTFCRNLYFKLKFVYDVILRPLYYIKLYFENMCVAPLKILPSKQ
jgi:hypothetical protein